jgi:hypothetical protein
LTADTIGQALDQLRDEARRARQNSRVKALNTARIEFGSRWIYNYEAKALSVPSASNESETPTRWRIDATGCNCPAGRRSRVCWHAAMYDIIQRTIANFERAQLQRMQPTQPQPRKISDEAYKRMCEQNDRDLF